MDRLQPFAPPDQEATYPDPESRRRTLRLVIVGRDSTPSDIERREGVLKVRTPTTAESKGSALEAPAR